MPKDDYFLRFFFSTLAKIKAEQKTVDEPHLIARAVDYLRRIGLSEQEIWEWAENSFGDPEILRKRQ